jgi:hypothetical protein
MTDYYPLLAKAVAGLKDATPEARQAIYERARKALTSQLRNLDPPVPEEAIAREAQALEIAVAQIETEAAAHLTPETGLPTAESEFYGLPPAGSGVASAAQTDGPPLAQPFAPIREEDTPKARHRRVRRKLAEEHLKEVADNCAAQPGETGPKGSNAGSNEDLSVPEPLAFEASDLSGPATERINGPPIMRVEALDAFTTDLRHEDGHTKRLMAVFGIAGFVAILIAIAAYRLRDRPEDLVRMQALPAQQGDTASGDKIADRVGVDRAGAGDQGGPGVVPSLPVAHRAALLVQAKDDRTKVNTYVGSVIWRAENVSSGPNEPLRTAVHAEIEIPEEKFRGDVVIQKNFDATLPASHTVKLVFVLPGDGPLGNIKQVSSVQMRQEDTPIGDTLQGITVPIMENSFLIGLARGEAEAVNLERLRSREWLDVPMVVGDGLSAKLTLEKGPSGQRVFNDAIASWQAQ